MKQIFFDMENSCGHRSCIFSGETEGQDLILTLEMPKDFLIEGAEYYLVTENYKTSETVFLHLLAKCENHLIFVIPKDLVLAPTVKFFVAACYRKNKEVACINESEEVYLFVTHKENEEKEG